MSPRGYSRQESGSILMVTLWMLIILVTLAVGLSREMISELRLTKTLVAKVRARYLAVAGLNYSLARIKNDDKNEETKDFDDLYQCGVAIQKTESLASVFQHVNLEDGFFDIGELSTGPGTLPRLGFQDEERRINLNAMTAQNYLILREFLIQLGVESQQAETLATAIVDWHDEDSQQTPLGGKNVAEQCGTYKCKNRAFDHFEELLLIQGMTPELFQRIRSFITIFPKNSPQIQVNFSTASREVLRALAHHFVGASTNTSSGDADSLVEKILKFRAGSDGVEGTVDDLRVVISGLPLNAKEQVIFSAMLQYQTQVSQFLRVQVHAREKKYGVVTSLDAVIFRNDLTIVAWSEN